MEIIFQTLYLLCDNLLLFKVKKQCNLTIFVIMTDVGTEQTKEAFLGF